MNYIQQLQQVYPLGEARALYRMVMEIRFGLSTVDLLLGKDTELSADDRAELENIMARLLQKEPVQYVLGTAEFCGHLFHVEPGVLIPRPETQELVTMIAQKMPAGSEVLDIGTGSGCIAISLALQGFSVSAFDISEEALSIAGKNAETLNASVNFCREDILHPSPRGMKWDAIVSNPPYICQSEAADMDANVLLHEPHLALFVPDDDPLLFYRSIANYAQEHLAPEGWLLFETNRAYGQQVKELLTHSGFVDAELAADQFGNDRFVTARHT